mmetsp:Transcript_12553/g.28168  ORF Transcript_12553/g.28168 Transcript_12553/m.28168 type:complete len:201 (-) Transcript_12553:1727-2329(-)
MRRTSILLVCSSCKHSRDLWVAPPKQLDMDTGARKYGLGEKRSTSTGISRSSPLSVQVWARACSTWSTRTTALETSAPPLSWWWTTATAPTSPPFATADTPSTGASCPCPTACLASAVRARGRHRRWWSRWQTWARAWRWTSCTWPCTSTTPYCADPPSETATPDPPALERGWGTARWCRRRAVCPSTSRPHLCPSTSYR